MPARPEAGDEEMEGILYLLQEFKGKVVLFGISDVVDIAIMAFLIYKVIMLMRRTNSGAVAKGVLLLLFALGVSTFFPLNTVSYLLQQLMVWGVVALVVIFQPEIRRFLEQMGRTSLGKVFTPEEARNELDSAITQTVDAYTSLSKSKTGALMVFERKNMLDDAIKTGTALDCTVNAELLKKEILELKDAGHTIIFSTHNMSSVEEICDNIALINRSQVVLSGNVTEVKSRFRTNNFTIRFHSESGKLQPIPEMFSQLTEKDLAGTSEVRIHKEPGITNSALLSALAGQTEIISFTEEIPSMNDIFINTVSGTNTTQA